MVIQAILALKEIVIITLIADKSCTPCGIHIVIVSINLNYVPAVISETFKGCSCIAANIAAVHAQFQHQTIKEQTVALAGGLSVYQRSVSAMIYIIISRIFNIEAYPVIYRSGLFIVAGIIHIQLIKEGIHCVIHLLFLICIGAIYEGIVHIKIKYTVFLFGLAACSMGNIGHIKIIALIGNACMLYSLIQQAINQSQSIDNLLRTFGCHIAYGNLCFSLLHRLTKLQSSGVHVGMVFHIRSHNGG